MPSLSLQIRAIRSLGALVAVTLASACGGTQTVVCTPECPVGFRCTADGCISEVPVAERDMSVGPGDLAMGCVPACGGATPYCTPSRACAPCLVDENCPAGMICTAAGASFLCVPGCHDDARCGAMGGAYKCCNSQCVDTSKDAQNCGACATACIGSHSNTACKAGQCALGACQAGWGDCNGSANDGCETNLRADVKSCGACNMACSLPNAIAGCANGCYLAACKFGFDDCNGNEKDGCETNVTSDAKNCGACGMACPLVAHAKNTCVNASCQLTSCDPGWTDCDGKPANGCEIATGTDARNCGACGNVCAVNQVCINAICTCPPCNFPNAMSACVNNMCALGACNPGFANCDGNPANGCELATSSDVKNCGSCGNTCLQGQVCVNGGCTCAMCNIANARTKCVNNQCTFDSCLAGFGDCNNNLNDGCELALSGDAKNCGACGNVCPNNTPFCVNSMCTVAPPGCFRVGDVQQVGPLKAQYTSCDQTLNNGFTCVNPTVRYGNVGGGVPAQHGNNDFATWCKQLGCNGYVANSVKYGNRSYLAPAGKLFWCSGYDEVAVKWCDWQDGAWFNQQLDYHVAVDGQAITEITCN